VALDERQISLVVTQSVQNAIQRTMRERHRTLCVSDSEVLPFRCAKSSRWYVLMAFTVSLIAWQGFPSAWAQGQINDVHIYPRVDPMTPEGSGDLMRSGLNTHTRPIRANVDLVLVPVTVTDPLNRVVTGLDSENFTIYEGKQPQEIKTLSCEDGPVSLGVILDVSGSMATKIDRAREAVLQFLKTANPQDEFFLITFAEGPQLVGDFTQNVEALQTKLLFTRPKGRTALLDAIYLGLTQMREAKYPRKAILIISDGGDNHSRYTEGEIKLAVREADVVIHSIGIFDRYFTTDEERLGPELLSEIAEVTGGRSFNIGNPTDLPIVAEQIGVELRNQYVVGYRSKNRAHDGKWRKLKVRLRLPKGSPPLYVRAKTGYYAFSR
jgi:Ca-activated chloride channel family protein